MTELLGQGEAWARTMRMARAGTLPHGLIIEGPRGCGKSTAARLVAEALLCDEADDACRQRVASGAHADLHVIQRPEDRQTIPVDDVRGLQATLERLPIEGGARVAIVDPAEALNEQGQNALLKTLEEPGDRTWIVLVTGRPEGLLPTVRSRAARLRILPLDDEALRARFAAQGLDDAVVQAAGGCVGRAEVLASEDHRALDQQIAEFLADPAQTSLGTLVLDGVEGKRAVDERARAVLAVLQHRIRTALRKALAIDGSASYPASSTGPWLAALDDLFSAEDDLAVDVPTVQILDGLGLRLRDRLEGRPDPVGVRSSDRS